MYLKYLYSSLRNFVSKLPKNISASRGDKGLPIARPFFCLYTLLLNWKKFWFIHRLINSGQSPRNDGLVINNIYNSSRRRSFIVSFIVYILLYVMFICIKQRFLFINQQLWLSRRNKIFSITSIKFKLN